MKITNRSMLTGQFHTLEIDVTEQQIAAWKAGGLIQDVMPDLSPADREFLISGSTQEEWDAFFGGLEHADDTLDTLEEGL